jgi:outer membrane translocation and assembly module TamA
MTGRFSLSLVLFGAFASLFPYTPANAQLSARLKRCLPYPTLADEVFETTDQNRKETGAPSTVVVDSVELVGGDSLPEGVRRKLVTSVTHPGRFSADWLREVEDVGARGALQETGYFRPAVQAEAQTHSSDAASQHVAITLHIEAGPRYRLRSVQFRSVSESIPLVFSFEILRQQIPLADGAFFNVSEIRRGIDSLSRLHRTLGYIDFTVEPQTEIDDQSGTIAVIFVLDPQTRYRIGNVKVWGPDSDSERLLESKWKVGDIFNAERLDAFFEENKTVLPSDASRDDVQVLRNEREGTVELRFDFRLCPTFQRHSP